MSHRTSLVTALVGALVIGGATTGTTLALWHDSASITAGSLGAGAMSMTVNDGATALGSVTLQPGGAGVSLETTIKDTSLDGSKNLQQQFRVTSTSFASSSALAGSHLKLSVSPKPTGGCPTAAPVSDLAGYTSGVLGTTLPAPVDHVVHLCVTVAATGSAPAGGMGAATLQFIGEQVRPNGMVAGWSSPAENRTVDVTIAEAAPTAPVVTCRTTQTSPEGRIFDWAGSEASYVVQRADDQGGAFEPVAGNGVLTYAATHGQGEAFRYRVIAVSSSGTESSPSNVVRIARSGRSDNYTCAVVNP